MLNLFSLHMIQIAKLNLLFPLDNTDTTPSAASWKIYFNREIPNKNRISCRQGDAKARCNFGFYFELENFQNSLDLFEWLFLVYCYEFFSWKKVLVSGEAVLKI